MGCWPKVGNCRTGYLAAIRQGHAAWPDNPLSKLMAPVRQTILVIEVIPGSTTRPEILLKEQTPGISVGGGLRWRLVWCRNRRPFRISPHPVAARLPSPIGRGVGVRADTPPFFPEYLF
jgi:hypothetical protein